MGTGAMVDRITIDGRTYRKAAVHTLEERQSHPAEQPQECFIAFVPEERFGVGDGGADGKVFEVSEGKE